MTSETLKTDMSDGSDIVLDGKRFLREPEEVYHALSKTGETVSSHMLAEFRSSPKMYHKMITGQVAFADSDAFRLGRAAHKYLLEGVPTFEREYMVADGPVNPRTMKPYETTSKTWKDWAGKLDKPVVSTEEFELIKRMYAAICENQTASDLLDAGIAEAVVRTEVEGLQCQIRMDFFNPVLGIVDLKTCDCLDNFERDARNNGYMWQMAFYRMVFQQAFLEGTTCHLIAVEKREPYSCGVWRCDATDLDAEEEKIRNSLKRLAECRKSGVWPTGYELVRILRSTYR